MAESCYSVVGTLPHEYRGFTMQGTSLLVAFQRAGGTEIDEYAYPALTLNSTRHNVFNAGQMGVACGDPSTGRMWFSGDISGLDNLTRLDPDGTATLLRSGLGANVAGLAYCPLDDNVYVALDGATSTIEQVTQFGTTTTVWTAPHTSEAFVFPWGSTTPDGAMWFVLSDSNAARRGVLRVTPSGVTFTNVPVGRSGIVPRADSTVRQEADNIGTVRTFNAALTLTTGDCLDPGLDVLVCAQQQSAGSGFVLAGTGGFGLQESGNTVWASASTSVTCVCGVFEYHLRWAQLEAAAVHGDVLEAGVLLEQRDLALIHHLGFEMCNANGVFEYPYRWQEILPLLRTGDPDDRRSGIARLVEMDTAVEDYLNRLECCTPIGEG